MAFPLQMFGVFYQFVLHAVGFVLYVSVVIVSRGDRDRKRENIEQKRIKGHRS